MTSLLLRWSRYLEPTKVNKGKNCLIHYGPGCLFSLRSVCGPARPMFCGTALDQSFAGYNLNTSNDIATMTMTALWDIPFQTTGLLCNKGVSKRLFKEATSGKKNPSSLQKDYNRILVELFLKWFRVSGKWEI